jgi:hypothetical protein
LKRFEEFASMQQIGRLISSFCWVLFLLTVLTSSSFAGAPFPCIEAASSSHGNFLVIVERQFEPLEGTALRTKQVSFEVRKREQFVNAYQRMSAPVTFWSGPQWSVVLGAQDQTILRLYSCGLPLVTDDGEFLILLTVGPGPSGEPALRIYRRGDPRREDPDHGVIVKDVTLREIWPASKAAANDAGGWTDHSPEWFAGGTFDFSADNSQLIYKTQWGNIVRVELSDGTIRR